MDQRDLGTCHGNLHFVPFNNDLNTTKKTLAEFMVNKKLRYLTK